MRKLIPLVLILINLFAKVAISEIVRELDQKTDVSRLEYSLDKLMPKLVSAMQDRTGSLERNSQNKIDEVCTYAALPEEEILDIQCNLTSHIGKFYFSEYPDKEFEQEISQLADATAEYLLRVFGNFGDPLRLNIFEKQNILHLATGRLFKKNCTSTIKSSMKKDCALGEHYLK